MELFLFVLGLFNCWVAYLSIRWQLWNGYASNMFSAFVLACI